MEHRDLSAFSLIENFLCGEIAEWRSRDLVEEAKTTNQAPMS